MKKLLTLLTIVLLISSCTKPSAVSKSICDNSLPEGIIVRKYPILDNDMIIYIKKYNNDTITKNIISRELDNYYLINDTIKHCQ